MPGEIRNTIYRMVLTSEYGFKAASYEHRYSAHYELSPALLRVNREIYKEAYGILYRQNLWITLHVDETIVNTFGGNQSGVHFLPVVSRESFHPREQSAVAISLGSLSNPLRNKTDVVIGPQSIEYLVSNLWFVSIEDPDLVSNAITNTDISFLLHLSPSRWNLHESLLKTFANVLGCGRVSVEGASSDTTLHLRQMRLPTATTDRIIEIIQHYMNQGDEAFKSSLLDRAYFQYEHAHNFLMHIRRLPTNTTDAQYSALITTAFQAELRAVKALVALRQYKDALSWLDQCSEARPFIPAPEKMLWNLYRAFSLIGLQSRCCVFVTGILVQPRVCTHTATLHFCTALRLSRGDLVVVREFWDMKGGLESAGHWAVDKYFSARWERRFGLLYPVFCKR